MRKTSLLVITSVMLATIVLALFLFLTTHEEDAKRFLSISAATWSYKINDQILSRPIIIGSGLPNVNRDLADCCHGHYQFTIDLKAIRKMRQSAAIKDGEQAALFIPAIGGNFSIAINNQPRPYSSFSPSIIGPLVPISLEEIELAHGLTVDIAINGPDNGFAGIWRGPILVGGFSSLELMRQKDILHQVVVPLFFSAIASILALAFGYLYVFTGRQFPSYKLFALSLIPIASFQLMLSGLPRGLSFRFGAIMHYPARLLEALGIFALLTCFLAHLSEEVSPQRVMRQVSFRKIASVLLLGGAAALFCGAVDLWTGPNVATSILYLLAFYPIFFWPLRRMTFSSLNFLGFTIVAISALGSIMDGAKLSFRVFGISLPYEYVSRLTTPIVVGSTVLIFAAHFQRIFQAYQRSILSATRESAIVRAVQMVAHDIRRPFSLLKNAFYTVKHEPLPDSAREQFNVLEMQVDQAISAVDLMIRDMLSFRDEPSLSRETIDPAVLISDAFVMLTIKDTDQSIQIDRDHSHNSLVLVDKAKMTRVITNIIENALQATPKNGKIVITTKDDKNTKIAHISITNSGSFISVSDRLQIFDAFFTKGKADGTGLGLAIAKKIIEAHGGSIICESSRQSGTTFHISLPASLGKQSDYKVTDGLVAIVDDDPFILEASEQRFAPFKIKTFDSPTSFFDALNQEGLAKFVCVVTDYIFDNDRENGLSLATKLRERDPDLPVFLSSDFPLSNAEANMFAGRFSKTDLLGKELERFLKCKEQISS